MPCKIEIPGNIDNLLLFLQYGASLNILKGIAMLAEMEFEGQQIRWNGSKFKATTGLAGFQHPKHQCVPDQGPLPEGLYKVYLADRGVANDDGSGRCNLAPAWGIQEIPPWGCSRPMRAILGELGK